jgi:hypothetical protein
VETSNHPLLLRLKGVVVNESGKGRANFVRYVLLQSNASEPLLRCRKKLGDVKTEDGWIPRDQFGRYLFTARMASGMKAARTRYRLLCGTWEPVTPMLIRETRKRRPRER